jgi:hypothetical protein
VDKPVFIIKMPKLDDEAVSEIADFLHYLASAFESRYFHQLQRHHQRMEKFLNE